MRALGATRHWVATQWGGPEHWRFVDVTIPAPQRGEVTIRVEAAGMNPADAKHTLASRDVPLPLPIGYELSGTVVAVGEGTDIATGPVFIGDSVVAFRVQGAYAEQVTVPARDVFARPANVDAVSAASLLLAATTAADVLRVVGARAGETLLVHGGSGSVGLAVAQIARTKGIRVVATAGAHHHDLLTRLGAHPISYGGGARAIAREVRNLLGAAPHAAVDTVGTDEAIESALLLVDNRSRIVTIANATRAAATSIRAVAGSQPESARYRDRVRGEMLALAGSGGLTLPIARIFPLSDALEATALLATGHPNGKFVLVPAETA